LRKTQNIVSPSADPVWRLLVPYIPSMSMMVILYDGNTPLTPIPGQRWCSLLYDVY
jgi:hypothetical protein